MNRPRILKTAQPLTFSQYFDLPFALEDILAEFDCRLVRQINRNRKHIELVNESARREALIAPILFEVADLTDSRIYMEYSMAVSEHLRGTVDYYIASHNVVVVEAKQSDLVRSFTQLAIELIALDGWVQSDAPILYGIVTTGEDWRFGLFDRRERCIQQDPKRYLVPEELTLLLEILVGIVG